MLNTFILVLYIFFFFSLALRVSFRRLVPLTEEEEVVVVVDIGIISCFPLLAAATGSRQRPRGGVFDSFNFMDELGCPSTHGIMMFPCSSSSFDCQQRRQLWLSIVVVHR